MATDEDLVADFVAGNQAAFAELVERYRRELFSFLQRFINEAALAEDLFQETFIQVYRSAPTFDSTRRFRPWLFTIAANKARDHLGRRCDAARSLWIISPEKMAIRARLLNSWRLIRFPLRSG